MCFRKPQNRTVAFSDHVLRISGDDDDDNTDVLPVAHDTETS